MRVPGGACAGVCVRTTRVGEGSWVMQRRIHEGYQRHRDRGLTMGLVATVVLLAGSACVSEPREPEVAVLRAHPGGVIEVARPGAPPVRLATHQQHAVISAPVAGALWVARSELANATAPRRTQGTIDARSAWQVVPRRGDSSDFEFTAPGEGCYQFIATTGDVPVGAGSDSGKLGSGAAESASPIDESGAGVCLELYVDRTAPRSEVSVRAIAESVSDIIVRWSVSDPLPLSDGVLLFYSVDEGRNWRRMVGNFARAGEERWPHPEPGAPGSLAIRLDCADVAGNSSRREAVLGAGARAGLARSSHSDGTARPNETDPQSTRGRSSATERATTPALRWFDGAVRVETEAGGEVHSGGRYLFAGGSRVHLPMGITRAVIHGDEDQSQPLSPIDGVARLPRWTGGPYTITGRVRGSDETSPPFWIDSSPPSLSDFQVRGGSAALRVEWQLEDAGPAGFPPPSVKLYYRKDDGIEGSRRLVSADPVSGVGSVEVALTRGDYRVWIVARDAAGNTSSDSAAGVPEVDRVLRATVGRSGPRPLNFAGEVFGGGGRHLFFMSPGPRGAVESPLEVRVLATGTEAEVSSAQAPAGASSLLLEVPALSGTYWVEIAWVDARGERQTSRGNEPFRVDADPPVVRWHQVPAQTSGNTLLVLETPGTDPEPVSSIELLRRRSPSAGEWGRWPAPVPEPQLLAKRIELQADLSTWEEGHWEIAVVVADAFGNRTEPLAALPLRVDRTAPDPAKLKLPATATEGVPLQIELTGDDTPGTTEIVWFREGASHVSRRVAWKEKSGGWQGTVAPLPAGQGRLLVTLHDPAGNRAERSATLAVTPALEELVVAPGDVVDQGAPLFVNYRLSGAVPLPGLELQIRDGERVVARQALAPGKTRVVVAAPEAPGSYSVGIAPPNAGLFQSRIVPLTVRSGRAARGPAGTSAADPGEATGRPTAAGSNGQRDLSVQEELRVAQLISAFRSFQGRWQLGERGATVAAEKQHLIQELQGQLVAVPRHAPLRKALARLLTLAEEPDYRGALWVLDQGIALGGTSPDLASLLADAGVIALQSGQLDVAAKHLVEAIRYEDGAHRRYNLGLVYRRQGKLLEAEAELRRAVAMAPTQSAILRAWAKVAGKLTPEQREQARGILQEWRRQGVIENAQAQEAELLLRGGP